MYLKAGVVFRLWEPGSRCNREGAASYQGLTQALGALLDWAEELLKSTQSLWWFAGFRQSTCRTRNRGAHESDGTQCLPIH